MFTLRTLFFSVLCLAIFGCGRNLDVSGDYSTEVSQGSGKEVIVGDLRLDRDGKFRAKIGELETSGSWQAGDSHVFLQGSELLPSQYRVEGDRLIAQFEGVDAKQWRFVKKGSQSVANRLH